MSDIDRARAELTAALNKYCQFSRECEDAEYTDTGEMWTVAGAVADAARALLAATGGDNTDYQTPDTTALVEIVRRVVADAAKADREGPGDNAPAAVGVIFYPDEYDNGYFFSYSDARLVYANGETTFGIEFGDDDAGTLEDLFSEYGRVSHNGALAVRLSDGAVDEEDNAYSAESWMGVTHKF